MNQYERRNEVLKAMGYSCYKHYLRSDLWKRIRSQVLERDGGVCKMCQNKAYTAHHIAYSEAVLAGADLRQLIAICKSCHYSIEFSAGGAKKLVHPGQIHQKARTLSRRKGKKRLGKKVLQRCRCCDQTAKKAIGRDNICLDCYRKHGERVHDVAAEMQKRLIELNSRAMHQDHSGAKEVTVSSTPTTDEMGLVTPTDLAAN